MIAQMNEIHIKSIQEILEQLRRLSNIKGFVYRGQANHSWEMTPSLFRNVGTNGIDIPGHLERFKKYLIGRIENLSNYSDKEIWAIGQHYGLKTPLLDWTISPAIALFFAFEDIAKLSPDYTAIYAVDAYEINKEFCTRIINKGKSRDPGLYGNIANYGNDPFNGKLLVRHAEEHEDSNIGDDLFGVEGEFIRFFSPKKFNNDRLLAQRGIFSQTLTTESVNEILKKNKLLHLVTKIYIPTKFRADCMELLDSFNINDMSMYPDITGAAKYTNLKMKANLNSLPTRNTDLWL